MCLLAQAYIKVNNEVIELDIDAMSELKPKGDTQNTTESAKKKNHHKKSLLKNTALTTSKPYYGFHYNEATNIHSVFIPRVPSYEKLGVFSDKNIMEVALKRKRSLGGDSIESGYSRNEGKIIRNSASEIKKPIVVKTYHSQAPTVINGINSERTDLVTEVSGNFTSGKKLSLSKRAPSLATATYRGLTVLPDITPITSKFNLTHLYKQTKTPKNTSIVKKSTELNKSDHSEQDASYQIKSKFRS